MKPYYSDKWVTIYHGDCREILPTLDVKVDLVLTDLPYGNSTDYGTYDDTQENLIKTVNETFPLLRNSSSLIALTCGIGNIYKYPPADWIFAWFIGMEGTHSTPYGFNCWQPILVYGKDPCLARGLGRHADVILRDNDKRPIDYKINHPCPKPIGTWSRVITRFNPVEGLILDPFLGGNYPLTYSIG